MNAGTARRNCRASVLALTRVLENAMSATNSAGKTGTTVEPTLTDARFERACTESMTVERRGPAVYDVHHDGETYAVDLESGHCTCADCQFRGIGCKHAERAALTALFGDGTHTAFVARVARFARERECPNDVRGCHGPTTESDRCGGLPCQHCIESVRAPAVDEYAVWKALVGGAC